MLDAAAEHQWQDRLVRREAQEDCGFLHKKDPFVVLEEKLGRRFVQYRRQWAMASNFELETPFPLQLDFELSYSCNLKCPMCTWSLENSMGSGREDWFPLDRFTQIVGDGVRRGLKAIDLSYVNEPLMRRDLPAFAACARELGILDVGFSTNGTLLTPALTRSLIESGLTRIQFSIDAFSSESYDRVRTGGDYRKVLANTLQFLETRRELGAELPLVAVSFVKQQGNDGDLESFVRFWGPRVDYLLVREYLNPVLPQSPHFEGKNELFPEERHFAAEFKCTKPWQRMIVRHDGALLPCCTFHGAYLPMGNAFETPIEEVWRSPRMKALRLMHKRGRFDENPVCKACALSLTAREVKTGSV